MAEYGGLERRSEAFDYGCFIIDLGPGLEEQTVTDVFAVEEMAAQCWVLVADEFGADALHARWNGVQDETSHVIGGHSTPRFQKAIPCWTGGSIAQQASPGPCRPSDDAYVLAWWP
jgi:hypothetical protein